MTKHLIPMNFSVIVLGPSMAKIQDGNSIDRNTNMVMTTDAPPAIQTHIFQDVVNGTSLWLKSCGTFQLNDRYGYNSGTVLAQQMVFEKDDISVWHQDERFSFTCHANLKTGFCFGWLIDRTYSKSCRILDPGKAG